MRIESLRDLFIGELQDLYSAESQILKALPKMIEKASSAELRSAFTEHMEQTRGHVRRLDQIFDQLEHADRKGRKCKAMAGIIKENKELLVEDAVPDLLDAGMIAGAQKVEHYEIAVYGAVKTYAQVLGRDDWATLLGETLNEEKQTDVKLTQLAQQINLEAKAA